MDSLIIPTPTTSTTTNRIQVNVHIQVEVLAAEVARRQANVWLLENVGNLLRAESPELVLGERLVWRVHIILTSPSLGSVGRIGSLELDATTGEVLSSESLIQELITNAQTVAAN
jgi:hypothetical protein